MRRSARSFLPVIGLAALLAAGSVQPTFSAGDDGEGDWIRTTGDILQIALPILGGGATFFTNPEAGKTWDKEGTKQFAYAYGTAWGSTYLVKILASKARPNGANRTSYPSGHTMSAFAGAAFIDGRYGRSFGIPAYALAAFTGYSRVHSKWHYRDDVLAGASIGMLSNWYFVDPLPGKVQFIPTVSGDGYGFQVSVGGDGGQPDDPAAAWAPRRAGYHFAMGVGFVKSNVAGSKGAGDNLFTLSDLEGFNDPTTTAVVGIGLPVSAHGSVYVSYGPFEARDQGSFDDDVSFGGAYFPAGEAVESSWRYYDFSAMYEHVLMDNKRWAVRGGAGAGMMYSYATLADADGPQNAKVDDQSFYPYLALALEHKLSRHWILEARAGGMTLADDWILDLGGEIVWRPARAWDVALGYVYFSRKIESDTFYNKVNYDVPYLAFKRFW